MRIWKNWVRSLTLKKNMPTHKNSNSPSQIRTKNQLPTVARDYLGPKAAEVMKKPIFEPMAYQNLYSDLKYSTDVGDVSWLVPTVHSQLSNIRSRNRPPLLAGSSPGKILDRSKRNALRR